LRRAKTYTSPDGFLIFCVIQPDDGDVSLGFEGGAWHTQDDILAELAGGSEQEAVDRYVGALLTDKVAVCLSRVDGTVTDIWVADDDPEHELRYKSDNEIIEVRYWSGAPYEANPQRSK
jgi:hypothetical protein